MRIEVVRAATTSGARWRRSSAHHPRSSTRDAVLPQIDGRGREQHSTSRSVFRSPHLAAISMAPPPLRLDLSGRTSAPSVPSPMSLVGEAPMRSPRGWSELG
uniref:Uncharacterized protein n=1 Tax=Arundo donax TaxID=35708 RepID=A0A0A9BRU9_ARUDO